MIRRVLLAVFPLALLALLVLPQLAAAQEGPAQPTLVLAPAAQRQAQIEGGEPRLVVEAEPADAPAPTGKGTAIAFWIFALAAVGGAIATVTRRNAITAVMCLVATFFAIAGIYAMLFASFMAAIQVLVYAGAIMVLFVFVVMILNKEEEEPWTHRGFVGKVVASLGVAYLVVRLAMVIWQLREHPVFAEAQWKAGEFASFGSTAAVGKELFTTYLFPFEAISIALLIAIVGAVVLAHPDHPTEKHDVMPGGTEGGRS